MEDNVKKITIETKDYKINNGILFWVDKNAKQIDLPEGLEIIGEKAFFDCNNLEEIKIPSSVIKIEIEAFSNCKSLKTIALSDSLKEIPHSAFKGCINLQNINIPPKVTTIGEEAFKGCEKLEEIIIPSSIKKIQYAAFKGCKLLKKINLPLSVEGIYSPFDDNLQKIILTDNINYIGSLPKSLVECVIRYEDYDRLKRFIKLFNSNYHSKTTTIVLEGPELNLFQQKQIDFLISTPIVFRNNVHFFEEKDEVLEDEIQDLVDKINDVISVLPEESRNIINNKVNDLLKQYKKDLIELQPKFDNSDETIEFNTKDLRNIKPVLVSNLEMILLSLSHVEAQKKEYEKLIALKNIINTPINTFSEDETLEGKTRNIECLKKYLIKDKQEEINNKLVKWINDAIEDVSSDINNSIDDDIDLINSNDIMTDLKVNIGLLYDEVLYLTKKVVKYLKLLNSLTGNQKEYGKSGEINSLIKTTNYIIDELVNAKTKEELTNQKNDIFKKYIEILNNIINGDNLQDENNYKKIVEELRSDLMPLLNQINTHVYLDEYEKNKANKTNLLDQLNICLSLLSNANLTELTEELKLQPITNYLIEINNKILTNDLIDNKTKNQMRKKLLELVNKWINHLKIDAVETIEEYKNNLKEILKGLAEIDINVDSYIINMTNYNKSIR